MTLTAKNSNVIALQDMPTRIGNDGESKDSSISLVKQTKRITASGLTKYDCNNHANSEDFKADIDRAMQSASFHYCVAIGVSFGFAALMILISYLAFNWS